MGFKEKIVGRVIRFVYLIEFEVKFCKDVLLFFYW